MSLQFHKSQPTNSQPTLEILLFRVAGLWFGLRGDRHPHLRNLNYGKLQPPGDPALTELAGFLGELNGMPIFDLAQLLEITAEPFAPAAQLILLNLGGRTTGFAIEQAQAIQRVPITELKQLPPILLQMNLRPAVWAVWQRSNDELIPLLDFNYVLDKNAKQTLQLGQG